MIFILSRLGFLGFDSSYDREHEQGLKREAIVMISERVQYLGVKWAYDDIFGKNFLFLVPSSIFLIIAY